MNMNLKVTIGDNIKYFRTAAGLTQKDLASGVVGLSEKALAAYEQHKNMPDIEMLLNISKQLNVHFSVLLDKGYKDEGLRLEFTSDEVKLLNKFRSLSKNKQSSLLELLDIKHQQRR